MKVVPPLPIPSDSTLTRPSGATYTGKFGYIATVGPDAPRIPAYSWDGSDWVDVGILVENEATNLALQSDDMANAVWTKLNVGTGAGSNAPSSPVKVATSLTPNTTLGVHQVSQTISSTGEITFSCFLKASGYTKARLQVSQISGGEAYVDVDLTLKRVVSTFDTSPLSVTNTTITPFAEDWYRVSISTTINSDVEIKVVVLNEDGGSEFAGDGVSSLGVWGAQFEVGGQPTSYIPTPGFIVTRWADEWGGFFSNIEDNDYPIWSSATSYTVGQKVSLDGINYEALVANSNIPPTTITSPPTWLNLGWGERWKMFRKRIGNRWQLGTQSTRADNIQTSFMVEGRVDTVGIIGVQGWKVIVTVLDSSNNLVYSSESLMLTHSNGGSWWSYFFGEPVQIQNFAAINIPPVSNPRINIVIDAPGGVASAGLVVVGNSKKIGNASWGSSTGFDSYSLTKEDEYGNISITPRGSRSWFSYDVVVMNNNVNNTLQILNRLKDTPSLYIGSPRVSSSIIAGRFDRLNLLLSNSTLSEYTLEVRSIV